METLKHDYMEEQIQCGGVQPLKGDPPIEQTIYVLES